MKYATFLQRLIADFIDYILSYQLFLLLVLRLAQSTSVEVILDTLLTYIIFALVYALAFLALQAFLISRFGGSLGKLITGIAIVDANGKHISFWQAVFREAIAKKISRTLFGLGFWWILKDAKRQSWHDMTLDTFVIVNRPLNTILGVVVIVMCMFADITLIKGIATNFKANKHIYQEIGQEFITSLDNGLETSFKKRLELIPPASSPSPTPLQKFIN